MRVGLGPVDVRIVGPKELRAMAEGATAASFDALWLRESRAAQSGGGLAAASMCAQWTPVRVGAVVDAALYHPLHLAEDIAVADLATGGRIEVVLRFEKGPPPGYDAPDDDAWRTEWLEVFAEALAGSHVDFLGTHLRVPARLEANQPAPRRLRVNPSPAQPAVPAWVMTGDAALGATARGLGFGTAVGLRATHSAPAPNGRWPPMVFCGPTTEASELLRVASGRATYFVIAIEGGGDVAAVGRRLIGPLRMPELPEWVLE